MEEPEKTTAQLRAELPAPRPRSTRLAATMARWQWLEDTVRFPTFLRELAIAQQRCHDLFHFAPDGYLGLTELGLMALHASTLRRAVLNLVQNALDAMRSGATPPSSRGYSLRRRD